MSNAAVETSRKAKQERIVVVGGAVPEDMIPLLREDPRSQFQTYKFTWAVIHGIEHAGQVVDLISAPPISEYPRSKRLWLGYRKWDRSNGADNWLVPFINILGWKHLTRFLGSLWLLLWWSFKHRGEKRYVLLHGLLSCNLCAALCARLFSRLKMVVIIPDLPGLSAPRERWWRRALRPVDRFLIHRATQSMDGLIPLTRQISEDYAPGVPAMVMEGIVSVQSEELAKAPPDGRPRDDEFSVLFAGGMDWGDGIQMLLEALQKYLGPEFRVWLYGRGLMADEIRRQAAEDTRIDFPGQAAPEEVFRRSRQATVLINPRPSTESCTPYSFPSKLLEYMATGRPVVSTRLPGIPDEYEPYFLWLDDETPEGLATLLLRLNEQPREQLDQFGRMARDFVLREKNYRRQGKRMWDFIRSVDRRQST